MSEPKSYSPDYSPKDYEMWKDDLIRKQAGAWSMLDRIGNYTKPGSPERREVLQLLTDQTRIIDRARELLDAIEANE